MKQDKISQRISIIRSKFEQLKSEYNCLIYITLYDGTFFETNFENLKNFPDDKYVCLDDEEYIYYCDIEDIKPSYVPR